EAIAAANIQMAASRLARHTSALSLAGFLSSRNCGLLILVRRVSSLCWRWRWHQRLVSTGNKSKSGGTRLGAGVFLCPKRLSVGEPRSQSQDDSSPGSGPNEDCLNRVAGNVPPPPPPESRLDSVGRSALRRLPKRREIEKDSARGRSLDNRCPRVMSLALGDF
ncbi:unnamed protein product, partial [Lampetra fluviatilis]